MSPSSTVIALDPYTLPLQGQRLIEASAGTGKTFTLAILYLRLLLGLGGDKAWSRLLSVEEILVVTFTEAATEELRGRIRDNIHQLRLACLRGHSDHPVFSRLLLEIEDTSQAAAILLLAERQMDESAIYTIHGFCQRMLNLNAFESGMLFQQQLLDDEQQLLRQATEDFWRRYCYPLEDEIAQEVVALFSGPEHLLHSVKGWLQGELPQLKHPIVTQDLNECHQQNCQRITQMKQRWREVASEVAALILASDVDKRSYSKQHVPNWITTLTLWAESEDTSYQIPQKELEKFSQSQLIAKTKKGQPPQHAVFEAIDLFLSTPISLYEPLVALALQDIRAHLRQEKARQALLSFDDLLAKLDQGLQQPQGEALAQAIRERYPVAMVDEFQDTDPTQYRIFSRIYAQPSDTALLLIGDPKQAIYAFRGADIFTYIKARDEVTDHYSLHTNWRSSPGMVASVNQLFQRVEHPFLFADIPFLAVESAPSNQALSLWRDGVQQPAMRWWLKEGEGCNVTDYQQTMAQYCANDIAQWLIAGQQQQAWLVKGETRRAVTAADITVLVRSRREANLIRDALQQQGIASVYLSSRDSVYQTVEAQELLWVLQAILQPQQESLLRTALATRLLGYSATHIEALSLDSRGWDTLTDQFMAWQQLWRGEGFLPMFRQLMHQLGLAENVLSSERGERRLTDLMHVSELLQSASADHDTPHALLRFFAQQIDQPDDNARSQQLRLESDRDLVQIVTIHKSKGLEYPLVWLPFIAGYRETKQPLYHDRQHFSAVLDLHEDEESLALAEEERLAEDLRLLYVALTRSIWHCSLGIAPLFYRKRKYQGPSELEHSAVGYLVQQGQAATAEELATALSQMSNTQCDVVIASDQPLNAYQPTPVTPPHVTANVLQRTLQDHWRVTSYSALTYHASHHQLFVPGFDSEVVAEREDEGPYLPTVHQFPKGAGPGTFLHHLFENLDFTAPPEEQWVAEQLLAWGYDSEWTTVVHTWIHRVLAQSLPQAVTSLAQIPQSDRLIEMEFWIPIEQPLNAMALDRCIKQHDPLSAHAASLSFSQVQGMLKGFIDLVFRWQGKYYIADYKSNWLGLDSQAYTQDAMQTAMIEHRYDFQYQLYTLALHRYLRHRLPDYDYEQHFGGVYYLFLRGMADNLPGNGIFFTRPSLALIAQMDRFFSQQEDNNEPS
ncbi:exodeoxyribonuclease V subunit beta [Rosenbergiella australiborealis]|uniref:RecBCD enzyme subunit RecB n=1 Tax=Rosenbergiella australiborealis TaxID=1544696 RepID=A0ABS5TA05_9GAMM|nr:exodeoxyribonuclease V subunit beta [Rosenbergiella australiborealis]MBT0728355.1 exodeoxyribonuclease V subunit beta [Rosenbergiella australiborealis]